LADSGTLLDRGQGANNAICDSEKFVSAMIKVKSREKTLQEAVDEYDADVISRGEQKWKSPGFRLMLSTIMQSFSRVRS